MGETADTLARCVRPRARAPGALDCNVVAAGDARSGRHDYSRRPEIGVASTSVHDAAVALYLFALKLAEARGNAVTAGALRHLNA